LILLVAIGEQVLLGFWRSYYNRYDTWDDLIFSEPWAIWSKLLVDAGLPFCYFVVHSLGTLDSEAPRNVEL
jgi:hypothetical protein